MHFSMHICSSGVFLEHRIIVLALKNNRYLLTTLKR